MYLTHPLGITLGQVVIHRYDVNALALQRVQIRRECGYKCLTFTCTHLGDTSLVQQYTTDQLYTIVLHIENAGSGFSYNCESLHQQIVQCLAIRKALLELGGLRAKFLVRLALHFLVKCFYLIHQRVDFFEFSFAVGSEYLFDQAHEFTSKSINANFTKF